MVYHKISRWHFIVVLVSFFVIGASFGFLSRLEGPKDTVYVILKNDVQQLDLQNAQLARMKLPAISSANETGVAAYMDVIVKSGNGNIFVNLNNVLISAETQQSARLAARVASNLTKISISNLDIIYDLKADASILEGPSAGAAMAIATMAALQNKSLRQDVMITGTINHDGTIGPAGKVFEKAVAAKKAGAKFFLVPVGTSTEINYTESEYCSAWGQKEFCTPEFTPTIRDLSQEAGIEVIEVKSVQAAAKYFIV